MWQHVAREIKNTIQWLDKATMKICSSPRPHPFKRKLRDYISKKLSFFIISVKYFNGSRSSSSSCTKDSPEAAKLFPLIKDVNQWNGNKYCIFTFGCSMQYFALCSSPLVAIGTKDFNSIICANFFMVFYWSRFVFSFQLRYATKSLVVTRLSIFLCDVYVLAIKILFDFYAL